MKKILAIILDGFGMREDIYGNAVKNAGMNNFINIWNHYPHCLLKANGVSVNLPENQSSSSEYGHKVIGCGREIKSKLALANKLINKDNLKYNSRYNEIIDYLNANRQNSIHISILLSDGGVSSHIRHLKGFVTDLLKSKIKNPIYLDLISDGKDSGKFDLLKYLKEIDHLLVNNVKVSSLCGRYYALDETRDYKRTKIYYDLLFNGKGVDSKNLVKVIEKCYQRKLNDEYLPPLKAKEFKELENGDVFVSLNFSKNNQIQMLEAMTDKDFIEFNTNNINLKLYSLFSIDETSDAKAMLGNPVYKNTILEYLSNLGLNEALIYESIKAASVKYHLNGDRYLQLENCDDYMIQTANVDNFAEKPEMEALKITKTIIKCMEKDYDFILANFASPDIIGHTGNYQATIHSLQAIDVCLGKLIEMAADNFYKIVIVGSHSKVDTIIDRNNNVITKNTLSPVPFIILDKKVKLENGLLQSFTPTLLNYMDIAVPKEMKNTEILLTRVKN